MHFLGPYQATALLGKLIGLMSHFYKSGLKLMSLFPSVSVHKSVAMAAYFAGSNNNGLDLCSAFQGTQSNLH